MLNTSVLKVLDYKVIMQSEPWSASQKTVLLFGFCSRFLPWLPLTSNYNAYV